MRDHIFNSYLSVKKVFSSDVSKQLSLKIDIHLVTPDGQTITAPHPLWRMLLFAFEQHVFENYHLFLPRRDDPR